LCALCIDRGGEFTAAHINEYFAELGVRHELTARYTPHQNGVVERRNQIVVRTVRSMLKVKVLHGIFWGEAVTTTVYTLNRTPTRGNDGRTPYKLWVGNTPAGHHMRTFRCVVHVKITGYLKKLDDHSKPTIFVGYVPGSKASQVYDPKTQHVSIMRDVVFDEEAELDWSGEQVSSEFIIDYVSVSDLTTMIVCQEVQEGT
jgi:transposase InsO family protein